MKDIANMTSAELAEYIQLMEEIHRRRMTTLRALQRARAVEEEAGQVEDATEGRR